MKQKIFVKAAAEVSTEASFPPLLDLPQEILEYLLSFLPDYDFFNVAPVCHVLNAFSNSEGVLIARYRHPETNKPEMLSRMIIQQEPNIKAMGLKIFKAEYAGLIDKLVTESKREQALQVQQENPDDFLIMGWLRERCVPLTEEEFDKLTQLGQTLFLMLEHDPVGACMAYILICEQKGNYYSDGLVSNGDEMIPDIPELKHKLSELREEYIWRLGEMMPSLFLLDILMNKHGSDLEYVNGEKTLSFFKSLGLVDFVLATKAYFADSVSSQTEIEEQNQADLFSGVGTRDFISKIFQKIEVRSRIQMKLDTMLRVSVMNQQAHANVPQVVAENRFESNILRNEVTFKAYQKAEFRFLQLEKAFEEKAKAKANRAITPAFLRKRRLAKPAVGELSNKVKRVCRIM